VSRIWAMGRIEKSELLEYFLAEAEDYLNVLSFGIPQLESAADRTPILEELFRAAHTLKGAAAIVKLTVTSGIAHSLEDVLEAFKNKRLVVSKDTIELLHLMLDSIAQLVRDISEGKEEDEGVANKFSERVVELLASLEEAAETDDVLDMASGSSELKKEKTESAGPDVATTEKIIPAKEFTDSAAAPVSTEVAEPKKEDMEYSFGNFIRLDLRKIEDMFNLIGEVTILKNHMLKKTKDAGDLSEEVLFAGKRLMEEVNRFAERHSYSITDNTKYVDPLFSEFGELEFDRYDEQNIFSRKVQELTEDIAEAMKEMMGFYETFQDDIKTLDRVVNHLRSDLSDSRMMDIGRLFQRFVRPVKEMARDAGKKIEFHISGQSTKIDRVIFEKLFDPLMHMIRNSIGHGIESSDERVSRGKKKEGMIALSARREGINIVIEIMDDGAGINTGMIMDEAIKQGLVSRDSKISREEILSLIFLHGFSTAAQTDMTSGRGVGMNAVRNQIANINGTVELSTETGKGTTFRIRVPSSMAITNVIIFTYANIEFVIPASLIEEVVQYERPDELSDGGDGEANMINYRGVSVYTKKLSEVFHIAGNGRIENKDSFVIICSVSNKKVGLIVDDVFAQEEAIIKPVNRFLEGLSIYSGITISGDGKVRLVVNPLKIFEDEAGAAIITTTEVESDEGRRVLVVDDSLSVRKYLSAFFLARNLKVFTASNGAEALKELEQTEVDLIVADLEMPVMHGYELVSRIRAIEKLRHIPIIVLTSRSAGKHKEKALELGADEYMVKPFEERTMEDALRKYALLQTR
jgi:chemotaxis protein histidine kinase CheA/ActR/RegA family two-component response regulator